jgi:hypothetical protein
MRFSEFVADKENVRLQDVIPLLQLIYVNAHDWSVDDSILKVIDSKRKYVTTDLLVYNITNKIIKGELVYEYICDDEGNPCAIDPDTEEFATELRLDKSYVNIKSLIDYVVNDIKDASLITDELPVIAGIDVPKGKGIQSWE